MYSPISNICPWSLQRTWERAKLASTLDHIGTSDLLATCITVEKNLPVDNVLYQNLGENKNALTLFWKCCFLFVVFRCIEVDEDFILIETLEVLDLASLMSC